jgi:hypothetical protein
LAILVLLLVPPLVLAASDLWLVARAGGARGNEARALLMRSVEAGRSWAAERGYVLRGPDPAPAGPRPAIGVRAPARPLAERIPMCAGAHFAGDGVRRVPDFAYSAADHAQFELAIRWLGLARLVAYDACFNASPLGGWCEAPLSRARAFSQAEIEAELVRSGVARRENGRACWCTMPCGWRASQPPPGPAN